MTTTDFEARMRRVESLVQAIEDWPSRFERETARELVQAVLQLHATGLDKLLTLVAGAGETGRELLGSFADDDLVASMLALHELHPVALETRVRQALAQAESALAAHGGAVELVEIAGDVVRLRLLGACNGCASATATLRSTVEAAILAVAPEVVGIELAEPVPQVVGP